MEALDSNLNIITEEFHYHGVNMRYLGCVRSHISFSTTLRQYLLAEMIARSTKNILKEKLRVYKSTAVEEHKKLVLATFNAIIYPQEKTEFWEEVKQDMTTSFSSAFSKEEETLSLNAMLTPKMCGWIFRRLQDLTEIRFTHQFDTLLSSQLLTENELQIGVRVKYISVEPFMQALQSQGRTSEAKEYYSKALEMRRSALGDTHPSIASILENWASWCLNNKEFDQAEIHLTKALEIRRHCEQSDNIPNEENSLDIAHTLYLMADLERERGNFETANKNMKEVRKIKQRLLGKMNVSLVRDINFQAGIKKHLGLYAKAAKLYTRSLQILEESKGTHPTLMVETLIELARINLHRSQFAPVDKLQQRALHIAKKTPRFQKSLLAIVYNNLAIVSTWKRRFEDALVYSKIALSVREKALGGQHSYIGHTLGIIGLIYMLQGKYSEAEPLLNKAIDIYRDSNRLKATHPFLSTAVANLGRLRYEREEFDKAQTIFSQLVSIYRAEKKDDAIPLAFILIDYGSVLYDSGEVTKAKEQFESALNILQAKLEEGHADIVLVQEILTTIKEHSSPTVKLKEMTQRVSNGNLTLYCRHFEDDGHNRSASYARLTALSLSQQVTCSLSPVRHRKASSFTFSDY
eukprot:TRINITY_DN3341_c0_g1_i1.p1 TRINITY_DN3341_c0_g1~~TRINITY_DN3341_c0_g1_i1.p1  ORF type:complete len:695 (+),score=170.95 TRINITY_DN3341_c0_g1_i1:185-2086(+)